jgi:hypothetical protein
MGEMGKVYRGELPAEAIRPPPPKIQQQMTMNGPIQPDQESLMSTFAERRQKDMELNQASKQVKIIFEL